MTRAQRSAAGVAALIAVAAFGLFYHLDDRLLWADEAETALLAVNITKFGLPVSDDGKNDLSRTRPGSDSEHALWIWSPWLDEYVVAASFLVLGKSTLAARLPFAVVALASVLLLAWIAWRTSRNQELAFTAGILYATCVPFLLHARQSRYYALIMFAELWLLYGVQRSLVSPSLRSAAHVTGGLVVLFYCNYIVVPGNAIGIGLAALWLGREKPRALVALVVSGVALSLLALPWLLYARPGGQLALLRFDNFGPYLVYYLGELHYHVVSLGVLALPLLMSALERGSAGLAARVPAESRRTWEAGRELRFVIVCLVAAQLLFLGFAPDRFFRYVTPLIPLLLLFAAFVLQRFVPIRGLRIALVALMVSTNALSVGMGLPFPKSHSLAFDYPTFLRSIASDYEDRLEVVLEYLQGRSDPEDTVYVDDHELPLIFYTDMRILEARDSQAIWQEPAAALPDWVMPSGPSALVDRKQLRFQPGPLYEKTTIEVPRSPRSGSRPHPDAHAFFTVERRESFELYRKQTRNSETRPRP